MGLLNWTHLISQVECYILDSQATPEEFKEIISEDEWYKHEVWRTELWWFGRKGEKQEKTFEQMKGFFDWMGMDVDIIMGAMRYKIAEMVDELINTYADEEKEDEMWKPSANVA